MSATYREKQLYGDAEIMRRSATETQYRLVDPTGEGLMTAYDIFPGIRVIYNDMHMSTCSVHVQPPENMIEINHCREGQIECIFDGGEYLYLSKGDLSVNIKDDRCHTSNFPLRHYHGVSVEIDLSKARGCVSCILEDVVIDFEELMAALRKNGGYFVMRNVPSFEHIFSELYSIPDKLRIGYCKIKVLEILFFLCAMDLNGERNSKKTYARRQVETVKDIKGYLDSHWDKPITLRFLSERFSMSMTAMKKCFHDVFDVPIYTYLRNLRMQKAALLLRETDQTVLSIAGSVGYDNASKFSSAFRAVIGQLPTEYRKSLVD